MSSQARDFRGVIRPVGAVVLGIGVMIALCAGVGMLWDRFAPDPTRPQGGAAELALSAIIVSTLGLGDGRYEYDFRVQRPGQAAVSVPDPFAEELTRFGGYRGTGDVVQFIRVLIEDNLDQPALGGMACITHAGGYDFNGAVLERVLEARIACSNPGGTIRAGEPGDPHRLAARSVSLGQVISAIRGNLRDLPGGSLDAREGNILLRGKGCIRGALFCQRFKIRLERLLQLCFPVIEILLQCFQLLQIVVLTLSCQRLLFLFNALGALYELLDVPLNVINTGCFNLD